MRLIISPNTSDQHPIDVIGEAATLGHADDNTIVLPNTEVADYHAEFLLEESGWFIRDLAGRDDLTVNGETVSKAQLTVGTRITIAGIFFLVVSVSVDEDVFADDALPVNRQATHIDHIQSMCQCPACGCSVLELAHFCPRCGYSFIKDNGMPFVPTHAAP